MYYKYRENMVIVQKQLSVFPVEISVLGYPKLMYKWSLESFWMFVASSSI